MEQENAWELRPEEFSYQFAYFNRLTPQGTFLGGERARKFFQQSGLSYDILGAIWSLSDVDQDGQLSAAEFAVAMHLIHATIKGIQLPSSLPQALVDFLEAVTHPKLPPPADNHLQKCRSAFVSFQTNNGRGVLGAEAARYLLVKSNLQRESVIHIWTLSDMDRDGYLTFLEFTVAMHLIYVAKIGHYLPLTVDANSLFPSSATSAVLCHLAAVTSCVCALLSLNDVYRKFYTFIGDIQRAADRLPISQQPYVDPITPQGTPTSGDTSKGFISPQHFTMPPEAFRDSDYKAFVGNPFEVSVRGSSKAQDPTSGPSSPTAGSRVSTHSVVKEVLVVEERTEPVVQQAGSVEIVVPPAVSAGMEEELREEVEEELRDREAQGEEEKDAEEDHGAHGTEEQERLQMMREEEERGEREESSERDERDIDPDDLEGISRASQRFLEEVRDVPGEEEEIHWVTPAGGSAPFGMDQYRTAGTKGLSEAIEEMGIEGGRSEEESTAPVEPPLKVSSGQSGAARVISHMQQLEAQILSALSLMPEGQGDSEGPYDIRDTEALLAEMLNQSSQSPEPSDPLEQHRKLLESGLQAVVKASSGAPPPGDAPHMRASSPSIVPSERSETEVQNLTTVKSKPTTVPTTVPLKAEVQNSVVASSTRVSATPLKVEVQNTASTSSAKSSTIHIQSKVEGPTSNTKATPITTVTTIKSNAPAPPKANISSVDSSRNKKPANTMEDLDSILGDELADINDMFAEFEATDRKQKAPVELQPKKPPAATPVVHNIHSLDEIRKKREEESEIIAKQWEEEARRIEQEKLKELEMEKALPRDSDSVVQTLENEWKTLLQQEEQLVKETQKEKEARLLREREEQARLAKEKEEAKAKAKTTPEEMPLEEWIEWVEKNRLKEMTPEQKVEYEHKKKLRADALREKEEQRRREEEEKLRKARQKMSDEQRTYSARETDMKVSRVDAEELKRLQEQNARKEAEEKRQREEKAKQWKERIKQAEIEELKPKAQSSLAARWEEKIKNRNAGSKDYKSTVMGTDGMKASSSVAARKTSIGH